jgi:hypothetical protein
MGCAESFAYFQIVLGYNRLYRDSLCVVLLYYACSLLLFIILIQDWIYSCKHIFFYTSRRSYGKIIPVVKILHAFFSLVFPFGLLHLSLHMILIYTYEGGVKTIVLRILTTSFMLTG